MNDNYVVKNKKIKVLNMISHMNDGGAQRIVLNYLEKFKDDKDIEISLMVFDKKTDSYCNKIIEQNHFQVYYIDEPSSRFAFLKKIKKAINGNKKINEIIQNIQPDIVHIHSPNFLVFSLYSIIKNNIKVKLATFHNNPLRDKGLKYFIIKSAFKKFNFIPIFLSNEQKMLATNYYKLHCDSEIAYNGIDAKKMCNSVVSMQEARRILNIKKNAYVISAVGRLAKIKNYPLLINAFAEVVKIRKNALLVIAGDGEERKNLDCLANSLGINDKVLFLGNITNVSDLYCASDVFVMTSISEASPLVLLEAQICGTRVVISDGVPSEGIINTNVRKMAKNSTIDEWKEAILDDNYKSTPVSKLKDYTIDNSIKQIKNIYLKYYNLHATENRKK